MIDFKKMLINSQVLISPDSSIFLPKSNLYVFFKKKLNKLDLFFYRKNKMPLCGTSRYTSEKVHLFAHDASA
jgi:hypothetical protein